MFQRRWYGFWLLLFAAITPGAGAAAPEVVVSIKPVHSLVAQVMAGVGQPRLLVDGAGSPHDHALRPSQAAALARADLVFWVGPQLEVFLVRPLASLASSARQISLSVIPGIKLLPLREGEISHGEEAAGHGHAEGGAYDMHIWLDPGNAKVMLREIAAQLQAADPANAPAYANNAQAALVRLDAITQQIEARLKAAAIPPYMVFHDAYQYFEKRFGIGPVAIISLDPERPPGAARVRALQRQILRDGVLCVFAEPQFKPQLVKTLITGTPAKAGLLDPLGAALPDDGDLYAAVLDQIVVGLTGCRR